MISITSSLVELLLSRANIEEKPINITPWARGANNQLFRIEFENRLPIALKVYKNDARGRLAREYNFSSFAWENGVHSIPKPFSCSFEENLALYKFVEGIPTQRVEASHIQQALHFIIQLNKNKNEALHLPKAEEACLHIDDYFTSVEGRLERLSNSIIKDSIDIEAKKFIQEELLSAWKQVKQQFLLSQTNYLQAEDHILSPSDFGFHNALINGNGDISFIDFEYAGWDDPAKMICDFFCQPATPVPMHSFLTFTETIANLSKNPKATQERTKSVLPICRIKWCCIILNVFKNDAVYSIEKKQQQLLKAITYSKYIKA